MDKEEEKVKGIKNYSRGENRKERRRNEKMKMGDFLIFEKKKWSWNFGGERRLEVGWYFLLLIMVGGWCSVMGGDWKINFVF